MNTKEILSYLTESSKAPKHGTSEYAKWLEQNDFLQFLLDSSNGEILVYASSKGLFIYPCFLPRHLLSKDNYIQDILGWNFVGGGYMTWGYSYSSGKMAIPRKIKISKPLDTVEPKLLRRATPLTFHRSFEGRSYVEISQEFLHLHGLHFQEAKNSYSRLNDEGDIEDIIKIHQTDDETFVTVQQNTIDFHLFLTKSVLVRLFDNVRCHDWSGFTSQNREEGEFKDQTNNIYARRGILSDRNNAPNAGWVRGFQIIKNTQPKKKMLRILEGKPLQHPQYATFIANDWKHKKIGECSCSPVELGNYFVESDKPYETTPAFFKPEVLMKYKQDPQKYNLTQRTIACRNSWHLQSYDINEAGQVHTYLIYLGMLPYAEQLYWKSFNEHPKAGLSKRAIKTDFEGSWDLDYEPLRALIEKLKSFPSSKINNKEIIMWEKPEENLLEQLHYVVTNSKKEWEDEILKLEKIIIEGFKNVKQVAKALNCLRKDYGSIKLLGEVLHSKKIDSDVAKNIIEPLEELNKLRSSAGIAHRAGENKDAMLKKIISECGTFKAHFRDMISRCDQSFGMLMELIKTKKLDVPT